MLAKYEPEKKTALTMSQKSNLSENEESKDYEKWIHLKEKYVNKKKCRILRTLTKDMKVIKILLPKEISQN